MVGALPRRGARPADASILDRCTATKTCPKVIEHFGSAEIWGLKLSPEWVGTIAKEDMPLPDNVRRYYIGSTTHGGGAGGFDTSLPAVALARSRSNAQATTPASACCPPIRAAHRDGQCADGAFSQLGHARHAAARQPLSDAARTQLARTDQGRDGFPHDTGIAADRARSRASSIRFSITTVGPGLRPERRIGRAGHACAAHQAGHQIVGAQGRCRRQRIGGVPVVLREAPLGTYLGWNIIADGAGRSTRARSATAPEAAA